MKKISRLSLTQKLLTAVAIPLLIVAVLLGIVVNQQLNQAIPELLDNAGKHQVEARADEISRWSPCLYRILLAIRSTKKGPQ